MATKNFTQFSTATPLTTSDYVVGYNAAGTAEIKTQVKDIVDLVGETDSQTLSLNESTKDLSISSGNTVSLSSLSENADILPTVTNYLSTSNVLLSTLTVTNNLSVSRTANLSNVNVTGIFNFGTGTPALNVRNDGVVIVNTLSAATISATRIVGFETYNQSLNTTDAVTFQQISIGSTVITEGTIDGSGYGRVIGLEDGNIGGDFSFDTAVGFQTPAVAAGTRDNLGLGTSSNVQFATVSASNIQLTNATLQPGQTLTSSISSLIIRINGQQYRLPLLPI